MEEAGVFTVLLGNKFDKDSLKYYEEGFDPDSTEGIFSFNFDLGFEMFNTKENYKLTKLVYPANRFSFYYESSLARNSFKNISELAYDTIETNKAKYFIFDKAVLANFVNVASGWTTTKISKAQKEKGFAKIDQTLQVNTVNIKYINNGH